MSRSLSILFYFKKDKANTEGPQPIYLRITINGKRTEISTKRECEAKKWNAGAGRAKGTKEETRAINAFLNALQTKIFNIQLQLMIENKSLTGEIIKNRILGIEDKPRTLSTVIEQHNKAIEQLIDKGYTKATGTKYPKIKNHWYTA